MENTINWLLENAGPVIRYRVLSELCNNADEKAKQVALAQLLELPETKKRLDQLKNQDLDKLHGATYDCFENSLPMILDFGLSRGIPAFDQCINVDKIIDHYESMTSEKSYYKLEMYPLLLKAGYKYREIIDYITKRIDCISEFTKKMNFDIYDDIEKHKSMPKTYRDRPVVKTELFTADGFRLPMIYDIIGLSEMYQVVNAIIKEKIDQIIKYIFTPEYNEFVPFYGIMRRPDKRYQAIGWDCLLPFYHLDTGYQSLSMYLHRLDMFSSFPLAVRSSWYQKALEHFEQFKTVYGTYILNKEYLYDSDKCWFMGSRMGLGENRRKNYQESESTFRILKIQRNVEISKKCSIISKT